MTNLQPSNLKARKSWNSLPHLSSKSIPIHLIWWLQYDIVIRSSTGWRRSFATARIRKYSSGVTKKNQTKKREGKKRRGTHKSFFYSFCLSILADSSPPSPRYTHIHIMAARQSTPDSHSDNVRKRVCKACDRCRLKKSKVCSKWTWTWTWSRPVIIKSKTDQQKKKSVMDQAHVHAVEQTMQFAYSASERKPTIKCIPRGKQRKSPSERHFRDLYKANLSLLPDTSRCSNNNKHG
jgi:hypothetical protein